MSTFDKDVVINNIEDISAQQIAELISQKRISQRELIIEAGDRYDKPKRDEVTRLLNKGVPSASNTIDDNSETTFHGDETYPDHTVVTTPQEAQEADIDISDYSNYSGWDEARVSNASAEEIAEAILRGETSEQYLIDNFGRAYARSKREKVKDILSQDDHKEFDRAEQEMTAKAFETYLAKYPNGQHTDEAKEKIIALRATAQRAAEKAAQEQDIENAWQRVDKASSKELRQFLRNYPDSPYDYEANQLLQEISNRSRRVYIDPTEEVERLDYTLGRTYDAEEEISRFYNSTELTPEDILEEIRKNPNILHARSIKYLLEYGGISIEDLLEHGLNEEVVHYVGRSSESELGAVSIKASNEESFLAVDRPCKEIYIWGVPSSGKTCAIGAILHTLFRTTGDYSAELIVNKRNKRGYDYASQLRNAFNPQTNSKYNLVRLVNSTDLNQFYKIEFDITERTGRKSKLVYPYTLMDMAGELMAAIHRNSAGHTSPEDDVMLEKLDQMLGAGSNSQRGNRRIHIFCLEYGGENKRIAKDDPTDVQTYLESVGNYLRQKNYLRNDTDALYVLLTKVDLNKENVNLGTYLKEHYSNFINFLKGQCEDYEINEGRVICQPFSLGEVSLKSLCKLNTYYAQDFIQKILIEQGQSFAEGGFINRIKKALNS